MSEDIDKLIDAVEDLYGEDSDEYTDLAYDYNQAIDELKSVKYRAKKLIEDKTDEQIYFIPKRGEVC